MAGILKTMFGDQDDEHTEEETVKLKAEAICPKCGVVVDGHRCRLCGSTKTISSVSGNVIWMKNGRVVAAFRDTKLAYVQMAKRYNIPKTEWPAKFLD